MGLAALRVVPLKMLPYDNKNEFLVIIDLDEGSTLERASAFASEIESELAGVPEAVDYTTYVGTPGPMDFNGLVRHYYLRSRPHNAEIRVNLAGKKHRAASSHEITLRLHDRLTKLADARGARVKIVELPPGPPVLSSLVAEVRGRPDNSYEDLMAAAETVARRMKAEPGVVDVDDVIEASAKKLVFAVDQEKGALNGVSTAEIAETIALALGGADGGGVREPRERNPLRIELRLSEALRSSPPDLAAVRVKGANRAGSYRSPSSANGSRSASIKRFIIRTSSVWFTSPRKRWVERPRSA